MDSIGGGEQRVELGGSRADVIDKRDLGPVTAVASLEELLNDSSLHISKHLLDRDVSLEGTLDGDRAMKDGNTLGILIKDSLDVLGSP